MFLLKYSPKLINACHEYILNPKVQLEQILSSSFRRNSKDTL